MNGYRDLISSAPDPEQKNSNVGLNLDLVVFWLYMPDSTSQRDGNKPELQVFFSCWGAREPVILNGKLAEEINAALERRCGRGGEE